MRELVHFYYRWKKSERRDQNFANADTVDHMDIYLNEDNEYSGGGGNCSSNAKSFSTNPTLPGTISSGCTGVQSNLLLSSSTPSYDVVSSSIGCGIRRNSETNNQLKNNNHVYSIMPTEYCCSSLGVMESNQTCNQAMMSTGINAGAICGAESGYNDRFKSALLGGMTVSSDTVGNVDTKTLAPTNAVAKRKLINNNNVLNSVEVHLSTEEISNNCVTNSNSNNSCNLITK